MNDTDRRSLTDSSLLIQRSGQSGRQRLLMKKQRLGWVGFFWLLVALMFLPVTPSQSESLPLTALPEEDQQAIHDLFNDFSVTINAARFTQVEKYFHPDAQVTMTTQAVVSGRAGLAAYYQKWFVENRYFAQLVINMVPANQVTSITPGLAGPLLLQGTGTETYRMHRGGQFTFPIHWTAILVRPAAGGYQLLALHSGTSFQENPYLAKAKQAMLWAVGGGVVLGVGLVMLFLYLRKRRRLTNNSGESG